MKTTATITKDGHFLSKAANKYLELIESGKIEESELNNMFQFLNGSRAPIDKDTRNTIISALWNKEDHIQLSQAQNNKGINFLRKLYQTPLGKERKNHPFGFREIAVLNNFERFELIGEYNIGNMHRDYFVPLYRAIGKDGSFEYYYNGEVNIIG